MTTRNTARVLGKAFTVALIAAASISTSSAQAQDHRASHDRDRYQTPHYVYDDRYHHGHYYPAIGYCVPTLPVGNVGVTLGRGRFFFHAGVWYQPGACGYVVARPPIGIVVPVLPPGYATVWAGGIPYYYANDIFYAQGPGGYIVAAPPPAQAIQVPAVQLQPPLAPAPQAGASPGAPNQPAPATWYYCESAKSYYPYVATCNEGWRSVPASPPPPR
jgi:hypothetical protein